MNEQVRFPDPLRRAPPELLALEPERAQAARLLRAIPYRPTLSPQALVRIRQQLEAAPKKGPDRRLAFALAGLLVALPVGAVAAIGGWARLNRERVRIPAIDVIPTPKPAPSAVEAAAPSSAPVIAAVHAPRHKRVAPEPVDDDSDSAPVPLADEGERLKLALTQLHTDHDAAGALSTLRAFRTRYPQSALAGEARTVEIDADLELGHDAEALRVLESLSATGFAGVPRAQRMQVLRAELLARAGRCAEAVTVFHPLLGVADRDTVERALYGDATCRVRLGDVARGGDELRRYVREFPSGPHAADAVSALGSSL